MIGEAIGIVVSIITSGWHTLIQPVLRGLQLI